MAHKKRPRSANSRRVHPKRRAAPGSTPGVIVTDPDAPRPTMTLMTYSADKMEEKKLTSVPRPSELPSSGVVWFNVDGLGDAKILGEIGKAMGIHALAMEDVANTHQRPKAEQYDDHLFVALRIPVKGTRSTEQLTLFLNKNIVVTFQERPADCLDPVRERLQKGRGRIRALGADYLAYAVMDAVIDQYYPVIESYADELEQFEEQIVDQRRSMPISKLHEVRHRLSALNRIFRPFREMLGNLLKTDDNGFTDATRLYLRDCLDHVIQLSEWVDAYRDLAASLVDSEVAAIGVRTNEIMRVLTVIATIFIPLTFVAGVYGMNFNPDSSPWNMPELRWYWGYPFSIGLMLVTAIALLAFVWRRGWLSRRDIASSREK